MLQQVLMVVFPFWGVYKLTGGNKLLSILGFFLTLMFWWPGLALLFVVSLYYENQRKKIITKHIYEMKEKDPSIEYEITNCIPAIYFSKKKQCAYLVKYSIVNRLFSLKEVPYDMFVQWQHKWDVETKKNYTARINNVIHVSLKDPNFPNFKLSFSSFDGASNSVDKLSAILNAD